MPDGPRTWWPFARAFRGHGVRRTTGANARRSFRSLCVLGTAKDKTPNKCPAVLISSRCSPMIFSPICGRGPPGCEIGTFFFQKMIFSSNHTSSFGHIQVPAPTCHVVLLSPLQSSRLAIFSLCPWRWSAHDHRTPSRCAPSHGREPLGPGCIARPILQNA